ncbi:MAG: SIMPL domain-containing protein [Bryobacterales bacterium]|nr:SIMPL domain-containing protein [Bryobacterales bacterium]
MFRSLLSLGAAAFFAVAAFGQVGPRRAVVRASGDGVVSIKPDQAKVSVGVTTQAQTAQDASDQNATATSKVLGDLRGLLGANADIRTLNYSLSPRYEGNPARLAGYTASNTIQVTLNDLNLPGRVIDTAVQAGATNIPGISFSLKDPQPARMQALRMATMQAKADAEAIVGGLGLRLGNFTIAQEGSSVVVTPFDARTSAVAGTPTPIEVGNVDVRATVAIEAEMVQ